MSDTNTNELLTLIREDLTELKGIASKTYDRMFVSNGVRSVVDEIRDIKENGSEPLKDHLNFHQKLERKLIVYLLIALATGGAGGAMGMKLAGMLANEYNVPQTDQAKGPDLTTYDKNGDGVVTTEDFKDFGKEQGK